MSPGRAFCVGLQGISRSSCRTGHVGKAQRMVGASEAPELDAREKEGRQGSCVRLFETPWTVAYQAPLYMGFSRQGYWSGLPFPNPEDFPGKGTRVGCHFLLHKCLLISWL